MLKYQLQEKRVELRKIISELPWQRKSLVYAWGKDFINEMKNYNLSDYNQKLLRADKLIGEIREIEKQIDKTPCSTII